MAVIADVAIRRLLIWPGIRHQRLRQDFVVLSPGNCPVLVVRGLPGCEQQPQQDADAQYVEHDGIVLGQVSNGQHPDDMDPACRASA
jgi:hypothetical protein